MDLRICAVSPISGMWGLFRFVCDQLEGLRLIIEEVKVILGCCGGLFHFFMSVALPALGCACS